MPTAEPPSEAPTPDLARECLYRFLAAALGGPYAGGWGLVLDADCQSVAREAADLLREEAARPAAPGFGELPPDRLDLRPLLAELGRPADELRAEYDRVFGLSCPRDCPPYETEYHPPSEPFFRSQQMADIAGFYRAFGLEPSPARPERPDHIALELEFLALLLMKRRLALAAPDEDAGAAGRAAVCDEALRGFFRDHLAWWAPSFAAGLGRQAGGGPYAVLAQVLAALLAAERARLGLPPPRLPLRAAPAERPEEPEGCAGCAMSG